MNEYLTPEEVQNITQFTAQLPKRMPYSEWLTLCATLREYAEIVEAAATLEAQQAWHHVFNESRVMELHLRARKVRGYE
jgi:hypothetical protein